MRMSSKKAFLLAGLLLVAITLVVSTTLADISVDNKNLDARGEKTSGEASAVPQRSCHCCRWGPYGNCHGYCCKTPNGNDMFIDIDTVNEAAEESEPLNDENQGGHRGGRGHGGRKGGGRHGGGGN